MIKEVPSVLELMDEDTAKKLVADSHKKDKYIVYDLEYCMWKNQQWCDHNLFGFYPSDKCVVYSLDQLKRELSI